ncbi:STAS domain-containing protein [Streptomyces sp. NPDC058701]|uniref:STAS domain-containing protein n=1 Tax=Streptomyces sp. NPDC058701 TaxID=3346608 RepID=UPI0036530F7C
MTIEKGRASDVVRDQYASGDAWVIVVSGDLDMDSAGPLAEALESAGRGLVILDLSEVRFADSTALNLLLRFRRLVDLQLVQPSEIVSRLLTLTGADALFVIHDTLSAALAAPRSGAVEHD